MLIDLTHRTNKTRGLFHLIRLCYEYAFINGRKEAGLALRSQEAMRLDRLRQLLESDDPQQRRHRRMPAPLAATMKTSLGTLHCTLLNISGRGMFVACR
jgi:hypothetical protein